MGGDQGSSAPKEANTGQEEEDNYEQESLNYLSLALQIISDFSSGENLLEGEKAQRKKLLCYLEIDTLLSRVQLSNNAPDYKSALEDLSIVEDLCT